MVSWETWGKGIICVYLSSFRRGEVCTDGELSGSAEEEEEHGGLECCGWDNVYIRGLNGETIYNSGRGPGGVGERKMTDFFDLLIFGNLFYEKSGVLGTLFFPPNVCMALPWLGIVQGERGKAK